MKPVWLWLEFRPDKTIVTARVPSKLPMSSLRSDLRRAFYSVSMKRACQPNRSTSLRCFAATVCGGSLQKCNSPDPPYTPLCGSSTPVAQFIVPLRRNSTLFAIIPSVQTELQWRLLFHLEGTLDTSNLYWRNFIPSAFSWNQRQCHAALFSFRFPFVFSSPCDRGLGLSECKEKESKIYTTQPLTAPDKISRLAQ